MALYGVTVEIIMKEHTQFPEILTIEQAAELLQVSTRTIQRLVKTGEMPGRQVGTQWRFHRDRLLEWVRGNEPKPNKSMPQAEMIKLWADKTGLDLPQPLIDFQQEVLRRSTEDKDD